VSASPHWHVYLFERNGVRYVQINDLNGKVRAAFAAASGSFLTLPVGSDAAQVATPSEPQAATGNTKGDIVYQDGSLKVLVAPQADGSTKTFVANGTCTDPVECSSRFGSTSAASATPQTVTASGTCTDPVECSSRFGTPLSASSTPKTATAAGKCTDPVECSSRDPINATRAPTPSQTITTLGTCTDPVECSSRNP